MGVSPFTVYLILNNFTVSKIHANDTYHLLHQYIDNLLQSFHILRYSFFVNNNQNQSDETDL